jgi:transposase
VARGGRAARERRHLLQGAPAPGLHAQKKSFLFCERNEEERRAWLQQTAAIPSSKRIYIDEAGAQDTLTRLFGWSLKGTRCLGERRGHAKERVSMVAAWCQGEVLAPLTFQGSCGADLFEGWFQSQLLPLLEPGQVVILDNATFHRMSILRPLLEKKGCSLLPLPPYSPDFNKIEPLWNTIKHHVRHNKDHTLSFREKVDVAFCSL